MTARKASVRGQEASRLLSIAAAAERGIERVRIPKWANPLDHIKIDIIDGKPGPWLHLFAPFNKQCNGRDPVDFLGIAGPMRVDYDSAEFVPYKGPLPDSDEYLEAVAAHDRVCR